MRSMSRRGMLTASAGLAARALWRAHISPMRRQDRYHLGRARFVKDETTLFANDRGL